MKVVILHGTEAQPSDHWFLWLKGKLEKDNHEVWVPDLPGADHPDLKRYNEFFLQSGWDFSDNLMIGHSSGAVAINGLLEVLPESVTINSVILVGVFKADLGWEILKDLKLDFDYEKLKKKAKKFIVVHSDNDPICPIDDAKWVARQLNADFKLINSKGHFNTPEFPELLSIIKEVL